MLGKRAFLDKLTAMRPMQSLTLKGTSFEGSSPPSVFIGQANYPKVFAGPMMAQQPESFSYDAPEHWLGTYDRDAIINFRLQLLRGMKAVPVNAVGNRFAQQLQEIALSKHSLLAHAEFDKIPRGVSFSEDHQPFGPSAALKQLETENAKWQKDMQKAHYDTDLKAGEAVLELVNKGLEFTPVQKALSTGAFGLAKNRKLVPTRWSITATDDILGKHSMKDVRQNDIIKDYRVYESNGLNNYYAVMLTPSQWQYEAIEAFINLMDQKTFSFSDYESYFGRKQYSEMGGCYYAQRQIVSEHLSQQGEQAGAFVFREVTPGYVPTGVWVCRELTKKALTETPKTFKTRSEALHYIDSKMQLGMKYHQDHMQLINSTVKQKTLVDF
ncbi:MAG TPA: hypothetical protein VLJ21_02685 [Candidatus Binatia bacterium]|nr:hypothetical protein [Candidatus Binatia bacterium]